MLTATDAFRETFPGAVVGALAMGDVRNPERSDALEEAKRALERELERRRVHAARRRRGDPQTRRHASTTCARTWS